MTGTQERTEGVQIARGILFGSAICVPFWLALGMVLWFALR